LTYEIIEQFIKHLVQISCVFLCGMMFDTSGFYGSFSMI